MVQQVLQAPISSIGQLVQHNPHVRTAVLNDALEDAFRRRDLGFRSANDDQA